MKPSRVSVLIAGAGPSGLTLAIELARRGVDCRIVDRAAAPFPGSRGKGLQPRTLEVFEDLGVLDAVLAGGAPFPAFRMYSGTTVLWERGLAEMLGTELPRRAPDVPHPLPWLIPQWRTDAILRDRLEQLGGRVERPTELVEFSQDDDGVVATLRHHHGETERVRADFLVGTDGGRSFVRKHAGVGFAGTTQESERTLIGDVRADGVEGVYCHMFTGGDLAKRFSLWNLPASDHYQFVAAVDQGDEPELSLATVQRMLDERSGRTDIRLHDLRWISLYRINVRLAERFRIGRVFLAGDAAHVHSSAGGQGLNTSVQDAYNLGWKLAAVLRGAPEALLDSYHDERFPVAAEVLDVSTDLHRRGFRATTAPPGSAPAIHQLDITYRGSALAVNDRAEPGSPRAGDRAPDAPLHTASGGRTRLFEVFAGPRWTALSFGAAPAPDLGPDVTAFSVAARGGDLVDTDGHAARAYAVPEGTCVLVRPDGYLGLVTTEIGRVRDYLRRVGL
ncbi:FAD-dependent monooxygenase [Goodfellowiella coeruleoviolacea]|uniref:2-polyprenyl-6-methoxyphenol hydroxylase n=1 Tax=Goodfellowiella coeruleoviolacea TaxID=334858 RepID=A0AAE3KIF6_9PSEU|nr:FAD-dependent monooxygenase [Goodfellowiella coeruleoviolacea]MCP2167344.1 2-polyprenyl-6-methoxyphenol hydroxylase [Goodfellowiella coeruleoviolacea]